MGKEKKCNRIKISLNSSLKFRWNEEYNENPEILDILGEYLENNGFKKNKIVNKNKLEKETLSNNESFSIPYHIRSLKAVFGLKQVLKLLNENKLNCILLDSSLVSHPAISTVFGIKLNLPSKDRCPVYCIPNLSNSLSKKLNYSSISAIGFLTQDEELFSKLKSVLKESGIKINSKTEVITKEVKSKKERKKVF
uniref:Ribosomal protein L7Ae/L30e/S12e/Gadd45 domain-containing protein n=1 Tax=Strongyloides stercoralis TaxID=6248 RepID=A0A0K0EDE5_STRER